MSLNFNAFVCGYKSIYRLLSKMKLVKGDFASHRLLKIEQNVWCGRDVHVFSQRWKERWFFNFVLSINDNNIKQRSLEIYGENTLICYGILKIIIDIFNFDYYIIQKNRTVRYLIDHEQDSVLGLHVAGDHGHVLGTFVEQACT